jgi:hypothetical protein
MDIGVFIILTQSFYHSLDFIILPQEFMFIDDPATRVPRPLLLVRRPCFAGAPSMTFNIRTPLSQLRRRGGGRPQGTLYNKKSNVRTL